MKVDGCQEREFTELLEKVRWTWKVKVYTHLELELVNELRERAEEEAIRIFGKNLKDLLLAASGFHFVNGCFAAFLNTGGVALG